MYLENQTGPPGVTGPSWKQAAFRSVRAKAVLGVFLGFVLLATLVFVNYRATNRASNILTQVDTVRVPTAGASSEARAEMLDMLIQIRAYQASDVDFHVDLFLEAQTRFENMLAVLHDFSPSWTNPDNIQRLATIEAEYRTWAALVPEILELEGAALLSDETFSFIEEQIDPLATEILELLLALTENQHELLNQEVAAGLSALSDSRSQSLISGAVAAVLGIILAVLGVRSISAPLKRLTRAAAALAQGDFSQRTAIRSHDEFGLLSQAFDGMAANLEVIVASAVDERNRLRSLIERVKKMSEALAAGDFSYRLERVDDDDADMSALVKAFNYMGERLTELVHQAEKERNLLFTVIDNIPDNIFAKDRQSRLMMGNAAFVKLLGAAAREDIIGKTDFDFFDEDAARGYYEGEQTLMASGDRLITREKHVVDQDSGYDRFLISTNVLMEDQDGVVTGFVGISRDITQLKLAERQMRNAASSITASATEIEAVSNQQMASATEQDAAVSQTMATVEEVRIAVAQTAERAQAVADIAQESVAVSRKGQEAVADTVTGMGTIRQRVEDIAENILLLSERTQQIGEIIEVVNALADQSKLLALNASIEAARAGEEGKGFAVVAQEVRQLAEQSRASTARVRDILSEIQQATNTAVMVTEEGSKEVAKGATLVERAGEAIRELTAQIDQAALAASQIAASTHQQTNGMDQLANAMTSIKQASTQVAASTRQTEASVRELSNMARAMESDSDGYRTAANYDRGR